MRKALVMVEGLEEERSRAKQFGKKRHLAEEKGFFVLLDEFAHIFIATKFNN